MLYILTFRLYFADHALLAFDHLRVLYVSYGHFCSVSKSVHSTTHHRLTRLNPIPHDLCLLYFHTDLLADHPGARLVPFDLPEVSSCPQGLGQSPADPLQQATHVYLHPIASSISWERFQEDIGASLDEGHAWIHNDALVNRSRVKYFLIHKM